MGAVVGVVQRVVDEPFEIGVGGVGRRQVTEGFEDFCAGYPDSTPGMAVRNEVGHRRPVNRDCVRLAGSDLPEDPAHLVA